MSPYVSLFVSLSLGFLVSIMTLIGTSMSLEGVGYVVTSSKSLIIFYVVIIFPNFI